MANALYARGVPEFIADCHSQRIGVILREEWRRRTGHAASPAEILSWETGLPALAREVAAAGLREAHILLEAGLPLTSRRVDVLLVGHGADGQANALIIEHKGHRRFDASLLPDCVRVGGDDTLSPVAQALAYGEYLADYDSAFSGEDVRLRVAVYAPELDARSVGLLAEQDAGRGCAVYGAGDGAALRERLHQEFGGSGDASILVRRLLAGEYRPARKLLSHVEALLRGHRTYTLLDEQQEIFLRLRAAVREAASGRGKLALIVRGGPGTGKTVLGLHLLGNLGLEGYKVAHATGRKAFTTNIRASVSSRAEGLFKYFNGFTATKPDELDFLVCDEAHRIRETSRNRFSPKTLVDRPQVDELLTASRVTLFLLDPAQVVRPGEQGSVETIQERAHALGIPVRTFDLGAQFRCAGSESYIEWIENVLGYDASANEAWVDDDYDFQVVDSPQEMEDKLRARLEAGQKARIVAGFCWDWSAPNPDGSLHPDVEIGDWLRPWNRQEPKTGRLPPKAHPYARWATQDECFGEVGCIYSVQGIEFDWMGVILGEDFVWRGDRWVAQKESSRDAQVKRDNPDLAEHLANTYRVLLTRGMRGTLAYSMDPETQAYLKSRVPKR